MTYLHAGDKIKLYLLDWQSEINQANIFDELDVRINIGGYVGHDFVYVGQGDPLCDPDSDTLDVEPTDILFSTEYDPFVTAIDDDISDLPLAYSAPINYPNPFNAQTTISFGISQPGQVRLMVYDILGRIISDDEQFFNPGNHDIPWSGTEKASGVYYYIIQMENETQSGRMTLLK